MAQPSKVTSFNETPLLIAGKSRRRAKCPCGMDSFNETPLLIAGKCCPTKRVENEALASVLARGVDPRTLTGNSSELLPNLNSLIFKDRERRPVSSEQPGARGRVRHPSDDVATDHWRPDLTDAVEALRPVKTRRAKFDHQKLVFLMVDDLAAAGE